MSGQLLFVSQRGLTGTCRSFELQNVSTYDMFVTLHTLAAKEKDIEPTCINVFKDTSIDFAHNSSAFLTWHRYYLLIVESELRRVADGNHRLHFTVLGLGNG